MINKIFKKILQNIFIIMRDKNCYIFYFAQKLEYLKKYNFPKEKQRMLYNC